MSEASEILRNKRIIGGQETYILFPTKYPWAWEAYLNMEKGHWTPSEIQVAPDIPHYAVGLTEKERFMFKAVFSQLTTFDLLRALDISDLLTEIITVPEIRHALIKQAHQEAIHTWAYQYCIENLNMDQTEVYTLYTHVPELGNRILFSQDMAKQLKRANGTNEEYLAKVLLDALFFQYMGFEGVWFMANLYGPIQSLAQRGLMMGAAEQFQYIARDESLHVLFGEKLILSLIEEHPYLRGQLEHLGTIMDKVVELEEQFCHYAIQEGIFGYNKTDHLSLVYQLANARLSAIGIPKRYPEIPIPSWVHKMLMLKKEKNFFETRVTEYTVGAGLSFEDSPTIDEISNWK